MIIDDETSGRDIFEHLSQLQKAEILELALIEKSECGLSEIILEGPISCSVIGWFHPLSSTVNAIELESIATESAES